MASFISSARPPGLLRNHRRFEPCSTNTPTSPQRSLSWQRPQSARSRLLLHAVGSVPGDLPRAPDLHLSAGGLRGSRVPLPAGRPLRLRPRTACGSGGAYRRISELGRDRGRFANPERLSSAVLRDLVDILPALESHTDVPPTRLRHAAERLIGRDAEAHPARRSLERRQERRGGARQRRRGQDLTGGQLDGRAGDEGMARGGVRLRLDLLQSGDPRPERRHGGPLHPRRPRLLRRSRSDCSAAPTSAARGWRDSPARGAACWCWMGSSRFNIRRGRCTAS